MLRVSVAKWRMALGSSWQGGILDFVSNELTATSNRAETEDPTACLMNYRWSARLRGCVAARLHRYLASWPPGLLASWPPGLLASWPPGLLASWPPCLPASLLPCLPASLPPCLLASLPPCLPASLPPWFPASMPPCLPAFPASAFRCLPFPCLQPPCLPLPIPSSSSSEPESLIARKILAWHGMGQVSLLSQPTALACRNSYVSKVRCAVNSSIF